MKIALHFVLILLIPGGVIWGKVLIDETGGYEGVVVAINKDVPENHTIITRIKEYFTEASTRLFRATRNRVYFKNITILIPKSWSNRNLNVPRGETFDNAVIRVDKPNPIFEGNPYTLQTGGCGEPGQYIHLTPEFFLDKTKTLHKYGPPSRTIVHEWGHVRWGLFDEYPVESQGDRYFYARGKRFLPVRCNDQIEGMFVVPETSARCKVDYKTMQVEDACRFYPVAGNTPKSSIMFMQFLDSVEDFCDNSDDPRTRHTSDAPNAQNRLCNGQSSWEVMRKHGDFRTARNYSISSIPGPVFNEVQVGDKRVVLVMDVSPSMKTASRFTVMVTAVTKYIMTTVEAGTLLGLVTFSSDGSILMNVTNVGNDTDRKHIVSKLPVTYIQVGLTSIGGGLRSALDALNAHNGKCDGQILLFSDGIENTKPSLDETMPAVLDCKVIVDTVAISKNADKQLEQLARRTGGMSFFQKDGDEVVDLMDSVDSTVTLRDSVGMEEPHVTVESLTMEITAKSQGNGEFFIDESIGHDTTVTIISNTTDAFSVTFNDPNGSSHTAKSSGSSLVHGISLAKAGTWEYIISNSGHRSISISLNVMSKPRKGIEPIKTYGFVNLGDREVIFSPTSRVGVFSRVTQGYAPVLGAKVIAIIGRPSSTNDTSLELKDDGAGSDVMKNDGTYSGTFIASKFDGDGRYSVKIKVDGVDSRVVVKGDGTGAAPIPQNIDRSLVSNNGTQTRPTGRFVRLSSAGVFKVTNYTSPPGGILDEIPPARVTDLKVTAVDILYQTATLVWTAVGDDIDQGSAKTYEIVIISPTAQKNISTEDIISGNYDKSVPSGQTVIIAVNTSTFDITQGSLSFGVQGIDEAGNKAEMSNIATAIFVIPEGADFDMMNGPPIKIIPPKPYEKIYIIVGVVLGAIVLVFFIVALATYIKRRGKVSTASYMVNYENSSRNVIVQSEIA